jgi:ATP-dependent Clp protease ATP-binding subunit ClpA
MISFTDKLQDSVIKEFVYAWEESNRAEHSECQTSDFLIAVLSTEEDCVSVYLKSKGLSIESVRSAVLKEGQTKTDEFLREPLKLNFQGQEIPWSYHLHSAINWAEKESEPDKQAGSAQILLGVLRNEDDEVTVHMKKSEIDLDELKDFLGKVPKKKRKTTTFLDKVLATFLRL